MGHDPKETFGIGLLRFERYDTFVQSCCTCHGHKSHVITIVTCGLPHLQPKTGIKSCGCFTKIIISCCPRYQRCIQGSRHVRTMIERTNLDVRTKLWGSQKWETKWIRVCNNLTHRCVIQTQTPYFSRNASCTCPSPFPGYVWVLKSVLATIFWPDDATYLVLSTWVGAYGHLLKKVEGTCFAVGYQS